MDKIELTSFEFEAIIGIMPEEREKTQPISIQLSMGLDLEKAGTVESLADSIDYARVKDIIVFLAREGRWHLIESLALAICRVLLVEPTKEEGRAAIQSVSVSIRKPQILAPVAVPGVVLEREVDWLQVDAESPVPGVVLHALAHTLFTWVWRVSMAPGAKWNIPEGMATYMLSGAVDCDGETHGRDSSIPNRRASRQIKALEPSAMLLVGTNSN